MPSEIIPIENLSRFIFESSNYRPSDNTVRHTAFMPGTDKVTSILTTSVFRTSGLGANAIWAIAETEVVPLRGKPVLGRADLIAASVIDSGLNVVPQEPPLKHANIIGWSEEKTKRREIALELAAAASLSLKQ